MTASDFEHVAQATLRQIEAALDASGTDADIEATGDGVLELTFEDSSKIIVNRHSAAREIWVAARAGGFHFKWDGSSWRDTRDGSELFASLSRLVSAQSGEAVRLAPPGA